MVEAVTRRKNPIAAQTESIAVVLENTKESINGKIGRGPAKALSEMADTLEKYGQPRSVTAKKVIKQSGV